ncbi:MAG: sigma-54-dependent Fis family transcriptional regulator [Deltaproteobacteria bacterium]|nr:sigma-54-dependent Fis family transcriptional regulator [Deltaproteobacteria bacterium]MBW2071693.1 sigma-54-dependent Fis family transcriptional regulator [Deltaproteobacteria bacterium]
MAHILVVDDEQSMRELLQIMLTKEGYQVTTAAGGTQAINLLEKTPFDLVITDIKMKKVDGLEVLKRCKELHPQAVVILISAYATTSTAVEAMKWGAYDYLPKPFKVQEMKSVIRDALATAQTQEVLHKRVPTDAAVSDQYGIIGTSSEMKKIFDLIPRIAAATSNVLITGESGTGKELIAKAIHTQSPRSNEPFVTVNCGSMPETLMESELFGHKKGSFTGASATRSGLFEAAHQGTIFLDEIAELTPPVQVKLLRAVQEKKFKMVGGTEEISVDVRIISATNRDLEQEVMAGRFREDLYYRLNVIHIRMPPLRERPEDIPLLAQHFLEKYSRQMGKDIRKISAFALDILKSYNFPGNIRELENIIERSVALETSNIVLPDSLTLSSFKQTQAQTHPAAVTMGLPPDGIDLDEVLGQLERDLLQQALARTHGAKQKAADLLGISFRSFRYRLAKYGLGEEDEVEE